VYEGRQSVRWATVVASGARRRGGAGRESSGLTPSALPVTPVTWLQRPNLDEQRSRVHNRNVSFDNIPQSVLEDVRLEIQAYLASLLAISPEHPTHPVDLAGSGSWAELAVALSAGGTPLAIPRDRIADRRLRGVTYSQWGPDLALLEIPRHLVTT